MFLAWWRRGRREGEGVWEDKGGSKEGEFPWRHHREVAGGGGERREGGRCPEVCGPAAAEQLGPGRAASPRSHLESGGPPQ